MHSKLLFAVLPHSLHLGYVVGFAWLTVLKDCEEAAIVEYFFEGRCLRDGVKMIMKLDAVGWISCRNKRSVGLLYWD